MTTALTEMDTLKARLKATWESGDYGHFAQYLEPGALEILARIAPVPGSRMLDVGCGAGQIAIPASKAGVVQFFRGYYGPTHRAFAALDPVARVNLSEDLIAPWPKHNIAKDDTPSPFSLLPSPP